MKKWHGTTDYHSRILSLEEAIGNAFARNRNGFFICMLIFVVLYFTEFSEYMMRVDEEVAAHRTNALYWIDKGRWGTWIIGSFLIHPLNPVFSMFAFGTLITISFLLFCNLLQIKRTFFILVSFVLFSAFPTWYYLIEFKSPLLANGFAVFFASLAGVLFNSKIPFARLLFILFLVAAISIYQSSILITLVIATASLLPGIRHEEHKERRAGEIRVFLMAMTNLILLSVLSLVVYLGIWKILLYVFNFNTEYITNFLEFGRLLDRPFTVLWVTIMQAISLYSGMKPVFAVFPFTGVLFLIGCIAFFYRSNRYQSFISKSFVFILLLSLPVLINVLSGGTLPIRSMLAVPFVYWFFVVLALQSDTRIIRMTAKVLTLVVALQFFQLAAFSSFSHKFVSTHDQLLAGQLYQRIVAEIDDFDRSKIYPVDFIGSYSFPNHASYLDRWKHDSVTGLSIFGFGEQWKRANRYMELLGMGNFRMINDRERARISDRVELMTFWPDRGSVRNIDDIIVVKFGPPHNE